MLDYIHVRNMALIQEEEIAFGPGLNILTGETGAGKSMIIGSINVALGTDNFRDYVREGEQDALVELIFSTDQPQILEELEKAGIETEDGQIVLSRKWQGSRTVNRINGETVPLKLIREIASLLIDIHGQHEHQSLLHTRFHRELLDAYGGEEQKERLTRFRRLFQSYRKKEDELGSASMDSSERARQMDMLSYEVKEIEEARLTPGEDEALEKEFRRMADGQKIMEALSKVTGEAGPESDISDRIGRSIRLLLSVSSSDEALEELTGQLEEIESLYTDFSRALEGYVDDFSYDEESFARVSDRLDKINHLKSRYGRTIEEILSVYDANLRRLEELENYDAWLEKLKKEVEESRRQAVAAAAQITKARREKARALEEKITDSLKELNFAQVVFRIDIATGEQLTVNGADEVCFMISTNPGMPIRPLGEVASGGELSRVMLAIKSVMAQEDAVESLIFDEIDTGISGRTAQKVSEKMAVIAASHQVICITHLAQIAAMADRHFEIRKEVEEGKTATHVHLLNEQESVEELARILGGVSITDAVLASAAEMKRLARNLPVRKEA